MNSIDIYKNFGFETCSRDPSVITYSIFLDCEEKPSPTFLLFLKTTEDCCVSVLCSMYIIDLIEIIVFFHAKFAFIYTCFFFYSLKSLVLRLSAHPPPSAL